MHFAAIHNNATKEWFLGAVEGPLADARALSLAEIGVAADVLNAHEKAKAAKPTEPPTDSIQTYGVRMLMRDSVELTFYVQQQGRDDLEAIAYGKHAIVWVRLPNGGARAINCANLSTLAVCRIEGREAAAANVGG